MSMVGTINESLNSLKLNRLDRGALGNWAFQGQERILKKNWLQEIKNTLSFFFLQSLPETESEDQSSSWRLAGMYDNGPSFS